MTATPALTFRLVSKVYDSSSRESRFALREVSFDIPPGLKVAIVGRSGSGKSTLLHLAAGIDVPTQGEVSIRGRNLAALSDRARTLVRRQEIGLVFQFFYLLPHLSVRENVCLPGYIAGAGVSEFEERASELLEEVGLLDRAEDNIQELSGGEMQRVAICRSLLRKPRLLLADEPTGNLDDANSGVVMNLMLKLASKEGHTLVYVTHSAELASLADEVWRLQSGVLNPS
ncbi:MAG: ABC transporter ATP-binding protein [Acidobacteria bacterium]|nr:MAG: ABC transporter ATP-binding protein [Acidobacteriota bacterium]TDI16955.1 MAG: ABC transporter ATP-binding protein [Acidobacteriota bacterium]